MSYAGLGELLRALEPRGPATRNVYLELAILKAIDRDPVEAWLQYSSDGETLQEWLARVDTRDARTRAAMSE